MELLLFRPRHSVFCHPNSVNAFPLRYRSLCLHGSYSLGPPSLRRSGLELRQQLSWRRALGGLVRFNFVLGRVDCQQEKLRCRKNGVVKAVWGSAAAQTGLDNSVELNKRNQVSKRLERTSRYFKRLGGFGFWSQLVCTVVSAVILAFSVAITGKPTSPLAFYLTGGGVAAAFVSVFWSFGYIRLSHRLRNSINELAKAPPRAEVVKKLKNGIMINLVGMCSTLLGMLATVGILVAKALTSSPSPYFQGNPGYSPVLALDVFLVQACGNSLLSHFLGLVFSLELLRSVTVSQPPPENVIPKPA